MLKVSARLDLKIWADLPSCCRAPSVGTRTSCNLCWRFPNRFIWRFPTKKYTVLYTTIHWNWRETCQINASLENFRHCKTRLRIICEQFPGMAWLDAKTAGGEATGATCDQKHGTLEGNLLGNLKNGSQRSLGDAAGLPVFAKEDTTAQAISPHTAKETNQEDFRQAGASWAKKPRQWRHNAQRLPVTLAWLHDLIVPVLD